MEERLQKVIARAGVTSRRKAEELILEGRVTVNGRAIRELGTKIDPAIDTVAVDTIPIPRTQAAGEGPKTYILLYKPKGVVCTVKDQHGRPTVLDLVPPFPGKRLYPVGRLDEDSEGIVLLTNDGELTAKLTHPRYGVPKVYEVRVKGHLRREDAERIERGVWLSEGRTGRSRIFIDRAGRDVTHVRVTLTEGRNREIRRAFAKLDFPVLSVRRSQIGPVVGRGLESGQYRPLAADEVAALHESAEGESANRPLRKSAHRRRPGESGDEGEKAPPRPRRRPGKPDPATFVSTKKEKAGGDAKRERPGRTGWGDRGGRSSRGAPRDRREERGRTGGRAGRPGGHRGERPGGSGEGRGGRSGQGRGPGQGRGSRGPGGPGERSGPGRPGGDRGSPRGRPGGGGHGGPRRGPEGGAPRGRPSGGPGGAGPRGGPGGGRGPGGPRGRPGGGPRGGPGGGPGGGRRGGR